MTSVTLNMPDATVAPAAPGRSFFARVLTALIEARMRQAEREVARYRHLLPHLAKAD